MTAANGDRRRKTEGGPTFNNFMSAPESEGMSERGGTTAGANNPSNQAIVTAVIKP